MSALINVAAKEEITPADLMHNFYFLSDFIKNVSRDPQLVSKLGLDTDFQVAVADAVVNSSSQMVGLVVADLLASTTFFTNVLEATVAVEGYDGLVNNQTFLDSVTLELSNSDSFVANFVNFLETQDSEFFDELKGNAFQACFSKEIDSFDFGTGATGATGAHSLWNGGEPSIVGENSRSFIGFTANLDVDLDANDINLYVSKDISFPLATDPGGGTPVTLRFTTDGTETTIGGANPNGGGFIIDSFFDPAEGFKLLDISLLDWLQDEALYIKITGSKQDVEYMRLAFDFVKTASHVSARVSGAPSGFADVLIDTQSDWELLGGKLGEPEFSAYYDVGQGKIILPEGLRVAMGPVSVANAGASGSGVFHGRTAYRMDNPIYLESGVEFIGIGDVTIVKGTNTAVFRTEARITAGALLGAHTVDTTTINITHTSGEIKEGDLISYELTTHVEYYTVKKVNAGVSVIVHKPVTSATASSRPVTIMKRGILLSGFNFDGRGGVMDGQGTLNAIPTNTGGFAHFKSMGFSVVGVKITNCKAEYGGGIYFDKAFSIKVGDIDLCLVTQNGGGIFGGDNITARITNCQAQVLGGGVYASHNGDFYLYNNYASDKGGGIAFSHGGKVFIYRCSALNNGGGMYTCDRMSGVVNNCHAGSIGGIADVLTESHVVATQCDTNVVSNPTDVYAIIDGVASQL